MRRVLAALAVLLVSAMPVRAAASISINEPGPYHYLDTITFSVTVPKLKGYEYPMVLVRCYQGPDEVWASLAPPEQPVSLGAAGSSDWLAGDADCSVQLWAYVGARQGKYERLLASAPVVHVLRP